MHHVHLNRIDLNLLVALQALLEERHVSRAAERAGLSQSAMSRVLERLRGALGDDLLVRSGRGYERTPRGERLLGELDALLPRLDSLVRGKVFDPATTRERFRVTGTDYAAAVLVARVAARLRREAPGALLEALSWREDAYTQVESGAYDLALGVPTVPTPPPSLKAEVLYEERFVCLVDASDPHPSDRFTLEEYLGRPHASVITAESQQTMIDRPLGDRGQTRRVVFRSPYFLATALAVAGTDLVLTFPGRLATRAAQVTPGALRTIAPPPEIPGFPYAMVWHPRLDTDAAQTWFRNLVRDAARDGG
jgi:DNA-binding transcriptional LysR family regulator